MSFLCFLAFEFLWIASVSQLRELARGWLALCMQNKENLGAMQRFTGDGTVSPRHGRQTERSWKVGEMMHHTNQD